MKTREELAREWVHERLFNPPADVDLVKWTVIDVEAAYRDGFDAGFARAVEMLKSDAAIAARWAENMKSLVRDGKTTHPADFYADWLEKQSP